MKVNETGEKIVKQKKDFGQKLRDNMQKFIIAIVSILYITQGMFQIVSKDTTPFEVLGSVGIAITIGVIISQSMSNMGLKDGRKNESYIASIQSYGQAKEKATPYFDKLSQWCEYKNAQDLEFKKKDIIQTAGLNWKAFKFGYYDEHTDKLTEEQLKALEEAKKCRIAKLNSQELLSDLPRNRRGRVNSKFGESTQSYAKRNAFTDAIYRIGISLVLGMYSLYPAFTEDPSKMWASIVWNTLQIAVWLTFGIMKYYNSYSFIVDEYRQTHIIGKTEYFNEFIVTMENNPDVLKDYEESDEIDKYIEEYIKERQKVKKDE